jgi:hypothetical protein
MPKRDAECQRRTEVRRRRDIAAIHTYQDAVKRRKSEIREVTPGWEGKMQDQYH